MIQTTISNLDSLLKAWSNFKNNIELNNTAFIEKYLHSLDKALKRWEKALKAKSGTPIPAKYLHRTRPAFRKFTYKVSGKQYNSIRAGLIEQRKAKGHIEIKAWAEIGVPYAEYTNLGLPKRKSGVVPHWKNWTTDVLFGSGRSGIMSVNDIFDNFIVGLEKEIK